MHELRKSSIPYVIILLFWTIPLGLSSPFFIALIRLAIAHSAAALVCVILVECFIGMAWLNAIKDLFYVGVYFIEQKRNERLHRQIEQAYDPARDYGKIVLVYCTCNDFDEDSLRDCLDVDYDNKEFIILDDSSKPAYMQRIDAFAATYGVRVVRRPDRKGFKAGNLNNFLKHTDFRYFVLLDSDEIIPRDFIHKALGYFTYYSNVGIVQGNHIATRFRNYFMSTFSGGVNAHWRTYQSVKHRYGFSTLLGHGAMVSRACYDAVDGFPQVVAEDIAFAIEAQKAGFYTAFALNIICQEEFPVDYPAFKKRQSKWVKGNIEFVRQYSSTIFGPKKHWVYPLHWFEQLDILLFTYTLTITLVFLLYIITSNIILPLLGLHIQYPLWLLIPTVLAFLAPMMNDIIYFSFRHGAAKVIVYFFESVILYGSMFFTCLIATISCITSGAVFHVTPKENSRYTAKSAFQYVRWEYVCISTLMLLCWLVNGTMWSVALLAIPAYGSYLEIFFSNRPPKTDKIRKQALRKNLFQADHSRLLARPTQAPANKASTAP